jgi:branched-subunit amino acid aminotransferase/4-amino-4-deoxychorismate lyase
MTHAAAASDSPLRASEIAWLDGSMIPRDALSIPVGDAGFVLGATVTEQLRTFAGRLFLPDRHAARFRESLRIAGVAAEPLVDAAFTAAVEVAAHNHALGPAGGDLGVVIFATPGDLPAQHEGRRSPPRVVVHTFPLAFMLWARAYSEGVSLRSVPVTQVPATSWPLALKCRSRMHYHLADQVAAAAEPGARAILCHPDGRVSETSTANIAIVRQGEILTPPPADSLAGISLGHVRGLALAHGIAWKERSLLLTDLAAADEILLTSTPNCLLPATQFDGHPVGNGRPGDVYRRLLAAWSEGVGIDIARQARGAAG